MAAPANAAVCPSLHGQTVATGVGRLDFAWVRWDKDRGKGPHVSDLHQTAQAVEVQGHMGGLLR